MSDGTRTPAWIVRPMAETLVERMRPYCDRIEIAGSLRRGVETVGDIEIVAMPKAQPALFGGDFAPPTDLELFLDERVSARAISKRHAWGRKYRAFTYRSVPVDLFLVTPPATWGAILAIRTGPADYSRGLVTRARDRGLLCRLGQLVKADDTSQVLDTHTEVAFFEALGLQHVSPSLRGLKQGEGGSKSISGEWG